MEKKIKVFVDAHTFDREYQGVRTFIKEIYNILLERYPSLELFFGAENINQIRLNFPLAKPGNIIEYKSKISLVRFVKDIPSILTEHEIDFAHFQYLVPPGPKHCRYIVTTHDILFNDFKSDFSFTYRYVRNFLFKRSILKADIKTTVSEYSKERIAHYFHTPSQEIHVIPNGVNGTFGSKFASRETASDFIFSKFGIRDYILYVSRIEARKNHIILLKTYIEEKLYEKDLSLVFIGKESIAVKELNTYLVSLTPQQKSNIHWISQVDQSDLEAFYKGCRLFAYLSKAEGFGIPPLEAAVAKVPVLCANKTAMAEYDFFTPFLFDPYNAEDFRAKLLQLLSSKIGGLELERIANEVLERYSWERSAEILYKLISTYDVRNTRHS